MTEKTLEKSATKTCESCGTDFSCGAVAEKCWCFEIDLKKETLADLRENFKNCLCQDCLEMENQPRTNTN
jgi:hypothetical protein